MYHPISNTKLVGTWHFVQSLVLYGVIPYTRMSDNSTFIMMYTTTIDILTSSVGFPFSIVCKMKHTSTSGPCSSSVFGLSDAFRKAQETVDEDGFFDSNRCATSCASSPPYTTITFFIDIVVEFKKGNVQV